MKQVYINQYKNKINPYKIGLISKALKIYCYSL